MAWKLAEYLEMGGALIGGRAGLPVNAREIAENH